MPNINITVAGKIATNTTPGVVIVCGNSDYTVTFDLDAEWAQEPGKMARFVYYKDGLRLFKDVRIIENVAAVPKLSNIAYVEVGVYAGDLHTTTPAKVLCDRSILCGNAVEQITPAEKAGMAAKMGNLADLQTADKSSLVAAINEAAKSGGVTSAEKNLILTLLHNAAYTMPNMDDTLAQLEALWSGGGEVEPDEPETEKTLISISAFYSGGDVVVGTAVSVLTGVVVTAHYSDGTSEPVTAYTLNGTIAEGSNTIAVSYGGKTATFEVIGVAESGGGSDNLAVINSNTAKNNNATAFVINEDDSITVTGGSDAYGYLLVNGLTPGASYEISMDQSTEHTFYFTSVYGNKVENATDDSGYDTKLIGMRNFSYGEKKIVTLSATNYGLIIYLYGSYDYISRTNTFSNIIVKEV